MTRKKKNNERWDYWRDKCDTAFSKLIKDRDGWRCVETGANINLQTAHIISRIYYHIRWDPRNAVTLKSGRHKFYTHHPLEWEEYIAQRFGKGYFESLRAEALANLRYHPSIEDLKSLYEKLTTIGFASR